MKKTLALLFLSVVLVVSASSAFATCFLQSHNSFEARKREGTKVIHYIQCDCSWLDDDFTMRRYSGPNTNCPVCTKSINFYNGKKK